MKRNGRLQFEKELVGMVVLTLYNNRTVNILNLNFKLY